MKIVSVGDIHGLNRWKLLLFGTLTPSKELISKVMLLYDKIVFIGDYVDSFTVINEEIINNLLEIIQFKKDYEDKVILLWGNHDVFYYTMNFGRDNISGMREEMLHELNLIFSSNYRYFQLAYQYENYLFSHAGIHRGWWEHYVRPKISGNKESRFQKYLEGTENIADVCNIMFEFQDDDIFLCGAGRTSGGWSNKMGGPLWASKLEITKKPLFGYHQIVGHTGIDKITTFNSFGNEPDDTSVTIIDCLPVSDELYIIEI
jgi:hypothetical protein